MPRRGRPDAARAASGPLRGVARHVPAATPAGRVVRVAAPAVVTDPSDPKLAHLDGLNLSRAWMLLGMARGLPASDARIAGLRATAAAHRDAGLRAVTGAHYEGGHWLGTFAVYLVTAEAPPRAEPAMQVLPSPPVSPLSLLAAAPLLALPDSVVADCIATLTRASSWTLERAIPWRSRRTIRRAWSRLATGCSSRRWR